MPNPELIAAIHAHPDDDTIRLAYADWLDEYGSGDLDRATVEFIRISCTPKSTKRMPRAAYIWLHDNWPRLLPETLKLYKNSVTADRHEIDIPVSTPTYYSRHDTPINLKNAVIHYRGRRIWMRFNLAEDRPRQIRTVYGCSTIFEFWKGFCIGLQMWSQWGYDKISPALRIDQPLFGLIHGPKSHPKQSL